MNAATPPGASSRTALVARLARTYLTPRWKTLAAAALCAGVFAALSGALLAILQPAVNDLVIHPKPGALTRIPLMIVALALARALTQVLEARLVNRLGAAVVGQVQRDLFAGLIGADLARLRDSHTGVFVSQVLYDSGLIREAATRGLLNFLRQSLILLAAAWVMLTADWRLFLAVAAAGPLTLAVLRRYSRRGVKAAEGAMETSASLSRTILESLAGARVVKMEGREAFETRRVGAVIAERQGHIVRGDNARATAGPATEAVMTVVIAAVLAYAGWRAGIGGRAPGALLAFFAALIMAGQAVRQIANAVTAMTQGLAAAARLFAALDVKPAIGDRPGARRLEAGEGLVRLEAVSFAYGDGPTVLDDISIEARRGEVGALVGPSGAGKSTALNLIPRFYDVAGGRLTIDGVDVRDVTLASLRAQIALVTQEPFLFDDSIAANIAYARPGASTAEIEAAAEAAAAHAFIEALPRGYDSPVGEAGMRLSGGERQRIAIARAFLKDAPILLLDEATSALDAESEALVRAALARLMAGRTTLVIAHRLSTVQNADRIYVLDRGRVVETGTHGALIAQRGLYARLARSQHLEPAAEAAE